MANHGCKWSRSSFGFPDFTSSPVPAPQRRRVSLASRQHDIRCTDKIRSVLPNTANATVCNYFQNVVTRVGGFSSAEIANSWARYMTETVGFQAFVARSSQSAITPQSIAPQSIAKPSDSSAYNPQLLGAGYAVLVSYFDRPELAVQIQQALQKEVGLVSYGQRPYLLAIQTPDQATANATLKNLSDRGFWVMVVDSRRVTLLKSVVNVPAIGGR